jgi:hypothetical protein
MFVGGVINDEINNDANAALRSPWVNSTKSPSVP